MACGQKFGPSKLVECCDGHLVCNDCVSKTTKDELKGEKKGFVSCPKQFCDKSVPISKYDQVWLTGDVSHKPDRNADR